MGTEKNVIKVSVDRTGRKIQSYSIKKGLHDN